VGVAFSAATATKDDNPILLDRKVRESLAGLGIGDDRSRRHFDHRVGTGGTVAITARPGVTVLRKKTPTHPEMRQRFHIAANNKNNVAAAPAVPSVGAASGYVLFPSKRNRTGAAVTGPDGNLRLVREQSSTPVYSAATGSMETRFFPRFSWYRTVPSILAKSVSSLPRPTFSPG